MSEALSDLLQTVEQRRQTVSAGLSARHRSALGQFFTPRDPAGFLAGLLELPESGVFRVLDPGAGVGSLSAAVVARVVAERPDVAVEITAFELDAALMPHLVATLEACTATAEQHGCRVSFDARHANFVQYATGWLFEEPAEFDAVIANPPYRKVSTSSPERVASEIRGLRASNLYTIFTGLAADLLAEGGQISLIVPRSWANGPYHEPFRRYLLERVSLDFLHVYEQRGKVFADADVLQENVVLHGTRGPQVEVVTLSTSASGGDARLERVVPVAEIVRPDDPHAFGIRASMNWSVSAGRSRRAHGPDSASSMRWSRTISQPCRSLSSIFRQRERRTVTEGCGGAYGADPGFPRTQSNLRSALVLLCLLELAPSKPWAKAAGDKLWRTHQIMQWFRDYYGKDYKPSTRETVRRQTLHQFIEAGLVLYNPDDPGRPVNSQLNCYQIAPAALALLRTHDKDRFDKRVARYLKSKPGLTVQHARARGMRQIPVTLADGSIVTLTAGGQNVLIKAMVEQFCSRWTPGGRILYVGDAGKDDPVFDKQGFADLGVRLDKHGKLPDLVVHMADRNWLVLMEAASTHGPVDGKRHVELAKLFADCTAGRVYVSCFPSRAVMRRFLSDISWETEVWCAEDPTHLIHFNGERFLGPHI